MLKQTDTPETVRLSDSINDEEIKYVTVRKTLIKKWLNSLDIYCELEDVPNIALLGSGGGERAAVGMLGSLHQLEQDNLLGSLLYMCGVSGTTWCMSSLYSDPDWSLNKRCDEVIKKLKGPKVNLSKAVEWLKLTKGQNQDFNLTDFWGAFTASYFMKEMNTRCLSEEAHRNSTNPYPIYSAIELELKKLDCTKAVWFEMTPHESGFSGLGAFVPTSCLRSRFEGGTLIEKRKEMDMVLLQGICGSAIADWQRDIAEVLQWIWDLLRGYESMMLKENMNMVERSGKVKVCECVPSRVVRCVSELIKYAEDPDPLKTREVITTLGQLLEGHVSSKGEMLWNMDPESWKRTSLVERKKFIETVSLELILSPDSWAKDWKDKRCNCNGQTVNWSITNCWIFDGWWILENISPLVNTWEWGTTSNFLFKVQDARVPESMQLKEKIHLVDAALKINSPYPSVLRTSRKVDLIISLDFSKDNPFETVFSAKQYADELKLPFPPVNDDIRKEKDHPKGCYVFEGRHPEEPTVMHMPLFNLQNCQDEDEIKKESEKYKTFQLHYGAPEIDHLLEKAQANMRNNRDRILEQIKMAIQRRKKRISVAQ
ncbi:cytosolic phospholipase A2 zeta-like isoform X2 [Oncorhynchus nerka]|uniref:cytosolic phospholipase A2 zeta-like isoform X2 n=1 Tax=Oncorhynchus nerka TaxID=8023 RepID=UPI0011311B99|nr:cytosolic phospholipase A2 zeta-like isoform X2 [Oncorhynchus nerka]